MCFGENRARVGRFPVSSGAYNVLMHCNFVPSFQEHIARVGHFPVSGPEEKLMPHFTPRIT